MSISNSGVRLRMRLIGSARFLVHSAVVKGPHFCGVFVQLPHVAFFNAAHFRFSTKRVIPKMLTDLSRHYEYLIMRHFPKRDVAAYWYQVFSSVKDEAGIPCGDRATNPAAARPLSWKYLPNLSNSSASPKTKTDVKEIRTRFSNDANPSQYG